MPDPRTISPDALDLKFLRELTNHRGYQYLMDWVTRERQAKSAQLEKCTPEELGELQGFVRALRLVEGGQQQCARDLTARLKKRGISEEK